MAYLENGSRTHRGGDILNGTLTKKPLRSPFGEYLLVKLQEKGMNLADLARAAGMSFSRPKFLVCGHSHPSEPTCRRIAQAIGIPHEELWEVAQKSKSMWGERLRIKAGDRNYSVPVHSQVSVDVKDWLKAIARQKNMSYSRVIMLILTRAMKDHLAKHPDFNKAVEYENRLAEVHSLNPNLKVRIHTH